MAELIEHSGVVERTENDMVYVKITSQSACGSCSARMACGLAEAQDKIVGVRTSDAAVYAPGDGVMVGIRKGAGMMAVLLAYVGALAVLMSVLIFTLKGLGWSEGIGALAGLLGVGCYYCFLWLMRTKIETNIKFTITKND